MVEGFKEDEKGKRRASVLSSFHDNYSMCHKQRLRNEDGAYTQDHTQLLKRSSTCVTQTVQLMHQVMSGYCCYNYVVYSSCGPATVNSFF